MKINGARIRVDLDERVEVCLGLLEANFGLLGGCAIITILNFNESSSPFLLCIPLFFFFNFLLRNIYPTFVFIIKLGWAKSKHMPTFVKFLLVVCINKFIFQSIFQRMTKNIFIYIYSKQNNKSGYVFVEFIEMNIFKEKKCFLTNTCNKLCKKNTCIVSLFTILIKLIILQKRISINLLFINLMKGLEITILF